MTSDPGFPPTSFTGSSCPFQNAFSHFKQISRKHDTIFLLRPNFSGLYNVFVNVDSAKDTVLVLDLCAALITVDRGIRIDRSRWWVGMSASALLFFSRLS